MVKISIQTPTKCYLEDFDSNEFNDLKKKLTFNDTGVAFNLQALKKNRWLKQNKPHTYELRKKELEANLSTCMLKFDTNIQKPWFHPGSISYLEKDIGLNIISNEIEYPEKRTVPWRKPLPFDLYPYQNSSVEALIEAKHACVSLATGTGKTAVIMTLARELGLKTAIVTPSKSIFLEILKKFEHHFGKSNVGAYGNGKKRLGKKFTVCVSKSLTMIKEGSEAQKFFSDMDVVISDESHLNAANTLEKVFHGVLSDVPYRFFLSGTQVRGDGKDRLLESIIGKKVFSLSTKEAVEGKYICPVNFTIIETTSKDTKKYSDALKAKRKQFLYNENIADISAKIANSAWNCAQESTLILVDELSQIQMLASKLNVPFGYAHSADKKKAAEFGLEKVKVDEVVEAFNLGQTKVLIGTSCIATGTNMYCTHNTINWVGGSSEVRTKQGAIGRSVRVLENSEYVDFHKPKPVSKIYDFKITNVPLMEKHLQKRISMYKETTDQIKYIRM